MLKIRPEQMRALESAYLTRLAERISDILKKDFPNVDIFQDEHRLYAYARAQVSVARSLFIDEDEDVANFASLKAWLDFSNQAPSKRDMAVKILTAEKAAHARVSFAIAAVNVRDFV